jgi:hypothetical protein
MAHISVTGALRRGTHDTSTSHPPRKRSDGNLGETTFKCREKGPYRNITHTAFPAPAYRDSRPGPFSEVVEGAVAAIDARLEGEPVTPAGITPANLWKATHRMRLHDAEGTTVIPAVHDHSRSSGLRRRWASIARSCAAEAP